MGTKVVIVGRGPGIIGGKLGGWIDESEIVVRMSHGRYNKDYGFKIDYLLVTGDEITTLRKLDLLKLKGLWFYRTQGKGPITTDAEWIKYDNIIKESSNYTGEVIHINSIIEPWLALYKEIARPLNLKNHPHVTYPSKGTAGALMAIETFKPKRLYLLGMDNVVMGERTYHCHDFSAENKVIKKAAEEYSVETI